MLHFKNKKQSSYCKDDSPKQEKEMGWKNDWISDWNFYHLDQRWKDSLLIQSDTSEDNREKSWHWFGHNKKTGNQIYYKKILQWC